MQEQGKRLGWDVNIQFAFITKPNTALFLLLINAAYMHVRPALSWINKIQIHAI